MKFFLDTADHHEIEQWLSLGLVDGITTNPTLLSKIGSHDLTKSLIKLIRLLEPLPVSVEVTESDPNKIYDQARRIRELGSNVIVKIPMMRAYIPVMERLIGDKIPLNITLLFSLTQAVAVAQLGVTYVSPFVGRVDDSDGDGLGLVHDIVTVFRKQGYTTHVLAASIRLVSQIHALALCDADIVTVPPALLQQVFNHPLTNRYAQEYIKK